MIKAYFDGSSKGNPGLARIGYVIYDHNGELLAQHSEDIGHNTNNVAEYMGLIKLVDKLIELKEDNVLIQGDSKLVVEQVNGRWKVNKEHLEDLCTQARRGLKSIRDFRLEWVKREKNSMADKLAQG